MRKKRKYKEVGDRLRIIRGSKNQEVFARMLHISKPALQNYESGLRLPPGETLIRAAGIGGTTVDWLLCGRDCTDDRRGTLVMEDSPEYEILNALRALPRGRMDLVLAILRAMIEEKR